MWRQLALGGGVFGCGCLAVLHPFGEPGDGGCEGSRSGLARDPGECVLSLIAGPGVVMLHEPLSHPPARIGDGNRVAAVPVAFSFDVGWLYRWSGCNLDSGDFFNPGRRPSAETARLFFPGKSWSRRQRCRQAFWWGRLDCRGRVARIVDRAHPNGLQGRL